jgi:hypothetical protein
MEVELKKNKTAGLQSQKRLPKSKNYKLTVQIPRWIYTFGRHQTFKEPGLLEWLK